MGASSRVRGRCEPGTARGPVISGWASHTCRRVSALTLLAATHLLFSFGWVRGAEARLGVNWENFLARHDLVWEALPKAWDEGAFIGNGLLGAMIYSEGANALQWDVGRSDVTDRGNRIAIGRFALQPAGAAPEGKARLDLWNAEASGTLRTHSTEVQWRSFTHSDKLVSVIELFEPKDAPESKIVFQHLPALPAREEYKHESVPDDLLNPPPTFGEAGAVRWCAQPFKAGGGYALAWGERELAPASRDGIQSALRRRAFFFTVDYAPTGKPAPTKAIAQIQAAQKGNFEELVRSHRAWWHAYYPESFLSIPDTRMESFYWIQMYKLASGTRADRPALDLMGPWFRRTPWPKIWWNLNIQLTYWPVYTANRLALGESLTRMIDAGRSNLINNAPAEWRQDSAAIKRTSSYDCRSSLASGMDGKGRELGNLTWALHNYWLQYRYSGDEQLLRVGLYPILKRSIAFYLHLLKPGEDGKLHLPTAISPEYPETAPDTNYDLSLLRWGLLTLLAANDRLELNDPMAAKWRETLAKLTPFPVDPQTGYMIGAGVPLSQSHRHFSHLFMVYPLHLVDPQSAADRPLIEKSLDHWLGLRGALRGYSFTGASAMSSWLGRKEDVVRHLNEILEFRNDQAKTKYHVTANSMYLEAGPVIETPLAAAASIHEMILQSWSMEPFGTHIRVFPAVPADWKDVAFHNLLAEGAFEVSAVRRDGKTQFVQLISRAGAPCRVSTSLEEPIIASGMRAFKVATETDHNGHRITTIDLRKGETALLMSAKEKLAAEDFLIQPVQAQAGRLNFYGSPKAQDNPTREK